MSIAFVELVESRRRATGDSPRADLIYRLTGTADDAAARTHAENNAPNTHDGLVRQTIDIEPVWVDTTGDGDGEWRVTVRYGRDEPMNEGDSQYNFDTGGGTQHITHSKETIGSYVADGTAPDNKNAIGVTQNGSGPPTVAGCDIVVPVFNFSETHIIADDDVDAAYKATLADLTGKTNDDTFKGFAAGEVLFLGASGTKRGTDDWEITFKFAAGRNAADLTVGSITGIAKKGWEYLWVLFEEVEDGTAVALVPQPSAVYVEKVYEAGDLSGLGIGTR